MYFVNEDYIVNIPNLAVLGNHIKFSTVQPNCCPLSHVQSNIGIFVIFDILHKYMQLSFSSPIVGVIYCLSVMN